MDDNKNRECFLGKDDDGFYHLGFQSKTTKASESIRFTEEEMGMIWSVIQDECHKRLPPMPNTASATLDELMAGLETRWKSYPPKTLV